MSDSGGASFTIARLVTEYTSDLTNLEAGNTRAQALLRIIQEATAQVGTNARAAWGQVGDTGPAEGGLAGLQGKLVGLAAGLMDLKAAWEAVKGAADAFIGKAMDWQTTMTEFANNTGQAGKALQGFEQGIRQVMGISDVPLNSLADGMQHIANFGFTGAQATDVLKNAMESASSTGGNTAKTAELLANAMHEYGNSTYTAQQATDILHLAAQRGNATFEQFAESSGRAVGVAANLHVPLEQVTAAISALTQHGYNAAEAQTQVVNVMTHLINPSAGARDEIERLSKATGVDLVSAFSAAGLAHNGLTGTINLLKEAYQKAGLSEAEATQETMKLLNAQRGGLGMASLLGTANQDYNNTLAAMADVMSGKATPTADAYARSQQTLAYQLGELKNKFTLIATAIGTDALPPLTALATKANEVAGTFLRLWPALTNGISSAVSALKTDLAPIVTTVEHFGAILHDMATGASFTAQSFGQLPAPLQSLARSFGVLLNTLDAVKQGFSTNGIVGAFAALSNAIPTLLTTLTQGRLQLLQTMTGWAEAFISWLAPAARQTITGLIALGEQIVTWLAGPGLNQLAGGLLHWAQGLVAWIAPAIPGVVGQLGAWASEIFNFLLAEIPELTQNLLNWAGKFVDWILPMIPAAVGQLAQWSAGIFNWILDQIPNLAGLLVQLGQQLVDWIGPRIPEIVGALVGVGEAILNWIGQMTGSLVSHLGQWGAALVNWIQPRIGPALQELANFAGQALQWLLQTGLPALAGTMIHWGAELIGWVLPRVGELLSHLAEFAGQAIGWLLQTGLPALITAFETWGKAAIQWLLDIIPQIPGHLQAFGEIVIGFARDALPAVITGFENMGIGIINGMIRGLNAGAGPLLSKLSGLVNTMVDGLNNALGSVGVKLPHMAAQFAQIPEIAGKSFQDVPAIAQKYFGSLPEVTFPGLDALGKQTDTGLKGITQSTNEETKKQAFSWQQLWNDITGGFQTGVNNVKNASEEAKSAAGQIGKGLQGAADDGGNALDNLGKKGKKAGQGAKDAAKAYEQAMAQIVNAVGSAAKDSEGPNASIATALGDVLTLAREKVPKDAAWIQQSVDGMIAAYQKGGLTVEQVNAGMRDILTKLTHDPNVDLSIMAQKQLDSLTKMETQAQDKADKVAARLDAAFEKATQSVIQSFGKLAEDSQKKNATVSDGWLTLLDTLKTATDNKIPGIPDTINKELARVEAGQASLQELHDFALQTLADMRDKGDAITKQWAAAQIADIQAADAQIQTALQQQKDSILDKLTSLVDDASKPNASIGGLMQKEIELIKAATDAGLPQVAQTIQKWFDAQKSGATVDTAQMVATVTQLYQQLVQSGDQEGAALEQVWQEHQAAITDAAQKAALAQEKAAQQAAQASIQAAQSLTTGLGKIATEMTDGKTGLLQILNDLGPLMKAAADTGMGGVADSIRQYLQAAAAGGNIDAQQLYQNVKHWLDILAQSGNAEIALFAQNMEAQLQKAAESAAVLAPMNAQLAQQQALLKSDQAALKEWGGAVAAAQAQVQEITNKLNAAKQQINDLKNAQLVGEGASNEGIFQNQMAQKKVQLQIDQASLGKSAADIQNDPVIQALQQQLQQLQQQGQLLSDQAAVQFDPLHHQLEKLSQDQKEITFDQASKGIQQAEGQVDKLTPALDAATKNLKALQATQADWAAKVAADNDAIQAQNDLISQTTQALQTGQVAVTTATTDYGKLGTTMQQAFNPLPSIVSGTLTTVAQTILDSGDTHKDGGVAAAWFGEKGLLTELLKRVGGTGADESGSFAFRPYVIQAFTQLVTQGIPGAIDSGMPQTTKTWKGYLDQMKEDAEQDAQAAIDAWAAVPGAIKQAAGSGGGGGGSGTSGPSPTGPHLASGGIVTRATQALIGEGAGPEAVIPLDKLPDILGGIGAGSAAPVQQVIMLAPVINVNTPLGPEFKSASGRAWDPYMRGMAESLKRLVTPRPGNALGSL